MAAREVFHTSSYSRRSGAHLRCGAGFLLLAALAVLLCSPLCGVPAAAGVDAPSRPGGANTTVACIGLAAFSVVSIVAALGRRAGGSRRGPRVLGVVGCSASGKSTVCQVLQEKLGHCLVVCTDDRYLPLGACPRFDVDALPWPDGLPDAFRARGNADLNHPDSVHWAQVLRDVQAAVETARLRGDAVVILEGLMLLADHAGARAAASLCDAFVLLGPADDSAQGQEQLWRRKYLRSHLGNKSYRDRGVSEREYAVYWDSYVWPSWLAHGFSGRMPHRSLFVDCLAKPAEVAEAACAAAAALLGAEAPAA